MKNKLKVAGHFMGDKHMEGKFLNLRLGEVRYYPQDNPNILTDNVREISVNTLKRVFCSLFEDYIIEIDSADNLIEHIKYELTTSKYITNKAYICVKEASPEKPGTVFYLHNGYVLLYKEKFVAIKA